MPSPKVKDSLLADASAALDRLEEILGGDRPVTAEPVEAVEAVEAVPKGSPGFNLERETHDSEDGKRSGDQKAGGIPMDCF